jgi:hypothetical protein
VLPAEAHDPFEAYPTAQAERPLNGHEFPYDERVKGHGKLTVVNGNSDDAGVILSSSVPETPDRLFYVRAGMEATISGIAPGRYRIKFQIGKYWNPNEEVFQCVSATAVFDKEETYEEQETETDVEYSHVHLTLHRVVGGKARTTPLASTAFRRRRPK